MRVLYVDGEPTVRRAVELWLSRHGIAVVTAATLADARREIATAAVDGVFLDVSLPDGSGFELHEWILVDHPGLAGRVVFVSDREPDDGGRESTCMVLRKPFDLDELKEIVARWARGG